LRKKNVAVRVLQIIRSIEAKMAINDKIDPEARSPDVVLPRDAMHSASALHIAVCPSVRPPTNTHTQTHTHHDKLIGTIVSFI